MGTIHNLLAALICPCLMAALSQRPGLAWVRRVVYIAGVVAAIRVIRDLGQQKAESKETTDTDDSFSAALANLLLVANLSLVGPYAFSGEIYKAHPLPRQPKHPRIRNSKWFRYLDIFLSMDRKLSYPPSLPLKPLANPATRGQSIVRAIIWVSVHSTLVDFFTLWLPLLRGQGLYLPDGTRDFSLFCNILSERYGISAVVIRAGWMVCYIGTVFCGIQGGWEMLRGLAIGSGVWIEEEWPELMDRPHLSTSMTELWGRRYHQLLRSTFRTILSPFRPRKAIYILSAFIISGLYHVLVMYPLHGHFPYHYLPFFLGCGLVCHLERTFYHLSGKKVQGVWGWLWTWSWIYVLGWRSLEAEVNAGQMEGFRAPVMVCGYSAYPLDHLVRYLGWTGDVPLVS